MDSSAGGVGGQEGSLDHSTPTPNERMPIILGSVTFDSGQRCPAQCPAASQPPCILTQTVIDVCKTFGFCTL